MNLTERKIVDILKELRDKYDVHEIKTEFEGEGARLRELMRLKELTMLADQEICLKIGGCEAITDMYYAKAVGIRRIVAPMCESAFAMKKYVQAIKKVYKDELDSVVPLINVETVTGYKNIDDIVNASEFDFVKGVVIGRVDLTHSLGLGFPDIDSDQVFNACNGIFKATKKADSSKECTIGGVLGPDSIKFFTRFEKGLVNAYELRKAIFSTSEGWIDKASDAIRLGQKFEHLWYQNKRDYYENITHDDEDYLKRISNPNMPE